jgi:hypothetical protein
MVLDVEGDRERLRELGVWGRERDGPDDGESGYQLESISGGGKGERGEIIW